MLDKVKNIISNNLYPISLYARQISGTLVLFIIARYLSVYDYGLFSSYKNIVAFWFMFANLGFADYILVSSKANVKEVKLKIPLFLLNAILIAILMAFISTFCNLDSHILFYLVVIRTFFDGVFFSLILPYFQATKTFNTIAKINIVYAISIAIIAIFSYMFNFSLYKFLFLNIVLGLINFIQCSLFAKINYIIVCSNIKRFFKMIDNEIWSYVGVNIAAYCYVQFSSLYVSTFLVKEQAALYFSAFTIASVIGLLISAQVQKMMPELIKSSIEEVKTILNKNLKLLLFVTAGLFLFMLIFGKYLLLLLYGQEYYMNAYPVLLILMFGNICIAEAGVYGAYITASGNQKRKIPMQLEATALTIIGLLVLHKLGLYGAALSFLFAAIYISYRYTTFTFKLLDKFTK